MFDFINKLKSYQIAIFIIFVWLVITAIINPSGNFPLGDDWAYAKPVKTYLETGIIKLTDWASMTLIMQIFFGIIATKIFGFSFTVLRLLTIIFGTLGSVGTFYFLKENNLNNKISIFITFLLIFNPVYFLYSFCFMTDIPFYAFMILSLIHI